DILVNEIAPRPHNSGHATIEGNVTSQFEQHLRAILDLPLGNTSMITPSVMINLLGAEGFSGEAVYIGMNECLSLKGVHIHLYGKKITKPFRKMGHVTICSERLDSALEIAEQVRTTLQVQSA
ncbi:MAG: ATP-grasp domain-containing protein, partial [Flavobacteriales bacterium]